MHGSDATTPARTAIHPVTPGPSAAPPAMCVGMCTYNRGRRVVETLEAIMRTIVTANAGGPRDQPRAPARITRLLIIDNNSTDETGRIAEEFALACAPFPVHRIVETVQGSSAARARFIREAAEPYIALLDDDVIPDPGWAGAMLAALDANPKAGWVGGKVELAWETGPTRVAERCRTMLAYQDFGDAPRTIDRIDQGMVSAAFAARREALESIGWLQHRLLAGREGSALECGEDYEMCVRLRLGGWNVLYTPEARAKHLIPARRQTVEYLERLSKGVSLSKAQLKWLAEGRPGPDWARTNLATARRKLTKTRLLEWRPTIRRLKLAEHEGRVESWERLLRDLHRAPQRTG